MEQQTQQPVYEKTENKPSIKTNTSTRFAEAPASTSRRRGESARRASSMRSWKLLAIITIAIILTVGGILLLRGMTLAPSLTPIVQQTPPPTPSPQPQTLDTSNWQTYRNEEFGFEVGYLEDWNTVHDAACVYFLPSGEVNIDSPTGAKSISICRRHKDTPVNPVWIEYETLRTIQKDGEVVKVQKARDLASDQYSATIKRGDYYFTFHFNFGLDRKYDYVFDQILSTFRFVE